MAFIWRRQPSRVLPSVSNAVRMPCSTKQAQACPAICHGLVGKALRRRNSIASLNLGGRERRPDNRPPEFEPLFTRGDQTQQTGHYPREQEQKVRISKAHPRTSKAKGKNTKLDGCGQIARPDEFRAGSRGLSYPGTIPEDGQQDEEVNCQT